VYQDSSERLPLKFACNSFFCVCVFFQLVSTQSRMQLISAALRLLCSTASCHRQIHGSLVLQNLLQSHMPLKSQDSPQQLTSALATSQLISYISVPVAHNSFPSCSPISTPPIYKRARKVSSSARFPRSSLQLKLSLAFALVPGTWGQRATVVPAAAATDATPAQGPLAAPGLLLRLLLSGSSDANKLREVLKI